MHRILLDTDIGCDTDDWFALGHLLARDDCELLGITTVCGSCDRRAMLADMTCRLAGKDIPIYAGQDKTLIGRQPMGGMVKREEDMLYCYPHRTDIEKYQALEFQRRLIESHPGEIDLISIGMLTNIALLFSAYPYIPSLLRSFTIMGGRYSDNEYCSIQKWGMYECNIRCDAEAAAAVFRAAPAKTRVLGVELSCQYWQSNAVLSAEAAKVKHLKPVSDVIKHGTEGVWFHDPMAVYSVFDPDCFVWQRGDIEISLDKDTFGKSTFTPCENGRFLLAVSGDKERFFNGYGKPLGIELHAVETPKYNQ